MHYEPASSVAGQLDLADPIFGLVPIYFSSHTFATFAALMDKSIADTAADMETWAG
jgi:hypothetical protein